MDSPQKYILAIDLGTSGPKSAIVSLYGEVIGFEFQETSLHLLPNGGAEQNPDEWWKAILDTSKKVISKGLVQAHDIVAISCTSQWSGTVPVDKGGNPLMNAIIWMDSRGLPYLKKMVKGIINYKGWSLIKILRWICIAGGVPSFSGKDPISHILYIKNELPEIYNKTYKFLEPKDYLNLCFTGNFAASFDSITLHWVTDNRDISNIGYSDKLIDISTIDKEKLPELKPATHILGTIKKELADELGLNRDVKVIMGTPDMHSATVGSGAVGDYEGHIYLGTSSWIICHVPFKESDVFNNMASIPSAIPNRYIVGNEQETAGACLTFLKNNLLFHKDELSQQEAPDDLYKIFDRIVENVPAGSNKLIFTPWLYGERAPVENSSLRAAFFNQSLETNREHYIRAVLEGVAYNLKWLLQSIERFIKRRLDPLNIIGGGANSNVWCQIIADVFNRTIRQVKDPIQANVRGAAFLASVALGHISFNDIPKYIQIKNTYTPNLDNQRIYGELFKEFLIFYKKNKEIYARLNQL